MSQHYTWKSLVDPSQTDRATVDFLENGVTAHGTQTTDEYSARWELEASQKWVTARLAVSVTGRGWARSLDLRRDADSGSWSATTNTDGAQPEGMADPGIAPGVELAGALDCDLGRCPMTNTMPIRRLGLLGGGVPQQALLMAWVDMPSLRVIPSDQYYASLDQGRVHYVSGTRKVDLELTVDDQGVVLHYPGLAERVSGP